MKPLRRRRFLEQAGTTTLGLAMTQALPLPARGQRVLGSNERVRLALIGCGGRGMGLVSGFARRDDVEIAALCDIHPERLGRAANSIAGLQDGKAPQLADHMDRVLEDQQIDAVIVATPDHWHTPAAIRACSAGKDVYVEKPFSHNVWEGRQLVHAARKYGRVVQVGTQNRSAPYNLAAKEYIESGRLGDIRLVKVYNLKGGGGFHLGEPGELPPGFDWDAWLGPAAARPYHSRIFRGGWHQFWNFSGGDLADCGIHQLDLALCVLGDPEAPTMVSAVGGRMQHQDDSEVPDVEIIHYQFKDFVMTFELSHYANAMNKIAGHIRAGDEFPNWPQCATRIEFYGSRELMMLGRHGGGWQAFTSEGRVAAQEYGRHPDPEHKANFIECLRTRKRPNADVALAQRSTTVMHLGNIAHRAGNKQLEFDGVSESILNDATASRMLRRQNENHYSVAEVV